VYCQVEVSATGRSLVQKSPTECGVSVCDLKTSTMRGGGLGPLGLSSHENSIKKCGVSHVWARHPIHLSLLI
jgi:hypothetical protein